MSTKVVTGPVRLSYVHLFEPWALKPEDDASYSTAILIPKSDKKTLDALEEARQEAIAEGRKKWGSSWGVKNKKDNLKYSLHDGDEDADLERNPEYTGHMYMSVSSKSRRPGVVDRNVQPILDATEVYSGCFARVSINAFPYNYNGTHGVSFGLNHVQKLRDGEPLGGVTRAEDDFTSVEDEESDLI